MIGIPLRWLTGHKGGCGMNQMQKREYLSLSLSDFNKINLTENFVCIGMYIAGWLLLFGTPVDKTKFKAKSTFHEATHPLHKQPQHPPTSTVIKYGSSVPQIQRHV